MLNRLEMLRIFVAAAEAGSFKEAAVRLGISPQAVTRAVQDLEAAQGELLFHRSTRQVRITSVGEALAARARDSVRRVDALFQAPARDDDAELSGVVRIAAPLSMSRVRLMPAIARIAARYPRLRFDLRLSDRHADVVDEQIDIGVRFGVLHDSRFIARRMASHPFRVVGTPALIERVGAPRTIDDLQSLPTTEMLDASTGRPWPWMFVGGRQLTPSRPQYSCNDAEVEFEFVLAGLAFGQVPGFYADPHIAAGRLVAVLREHEPEPWELYVYRPQRGPVPGRIRVVYDALVEGLSGGGG